ncbi:MAG: hypothetical protein R3282_01320 [Rhodothermales bacterium]|nr:hypothetical protein [Rhodothermales bacterium]
MLRRDTMCRVRVPVLVAAALMLPTRTAVAQNAVGPTPTDSVVVEVTDAPRDTLSAPSDSLRAPLRFRVRRRSAIDRSVADTIPPRVYAFELTELLKEQPGSFLFDFSTYGWPHVWSPFGITQQNVGVVWNGVEMSDLFTGRARYEAVPLGASVAPTVSYGHRSRLSTIVAATRPYEQSAQPTTEFQYQAGGGLQKITALHSQSRRISIGSDGLLNLVFWYRGEGSTGEYPGSRLRRGRQVYGRLLYSRPKWSLEISDVNTRHPLQAQGGVIERVPGDFNSIYQRLGAQVVDEFARRRTFRNDLFGRWIRDTGSTGELSLTAGRTSESLQFRRPGDTLEVASARSFGDLRQHLRFGKNLLSIGAEGSVTRSEARSDTLAFGSVVDRRLMLSATHSYAGEWVQARLSGGMDVRSEGSAPVAGLTVNVAFGTAHIALNAATRPEAATVMELVGFGPFLTVSGDRELGRVHHVSGKIGFEAGPVDLALIGSVTSSDSWREMFTTATDDSVRLRPGAGRLTVTSAGVEAGLRRNARRGFYLVAAPTLFSVGNAAGSSDLERFSASLPEFYAVGRLGARYLLFHGDLDLNIFVRGRFWSDFRSRTLHTPTGLLALPTAGSRPVESSAALDIVLEGGVRVATLFVAYENLLSGTNAVPGNLLVPVYPLAEQRLRFGVFWPISN